MYFTKSYSCLIYLILVTLTTGLWATSLEKKGIVTEVDITNASLMMQWSGKDAAEPVKVAVSAGDAGIWQEGDYLRGIVFPSDGKLRMETIWPGDLREAAQIAAVNRKLRLDTSARGQKAFRAVGEFLPKFALWNDKGEVVQPSKYRGRYVVMNFIFTRCSQPTMCPASTRKMRELQQLAEEAGLGNLQLVSFTLDPEYDTPGVLASYREQWGIDPWNFDFLTGPVKPLEDLQAQLGVLAEEDEDLIINHTIMVVVADTKGKLFYQVPGSGWSPKDILRQIEIHEERLSAGSKVNN